MAFVSCGYCGHPGTHAQVIEVPGEPKKKCVGCPKCFPPDGVPRLTEDTKK